MVKYNIGCGSSDFGAKWIHVDKVKYSHIVDADIFLNCAAGNSTDLIYSSHFLEYFDLVDALDILQEWYSVLKPGGTLQIAVPDFEKIVQVYQKTGIILEGPLFGKLESGIYHKTVFDHSRLRDMLLSVGFKGIKKVDTFKATAKYGDCSNAIFEGIKISLNLECVK